MMGKSSRQKSGKNIFRGPDIQGKIEDEKILKWSKWSFFKILVKIEGQKTKQNEIPVRIQGPNVSRRFFTSQKQHFYFLE